MIFKVSDQLIWAWKTLLSDISFHNHSIKMKFSPISQICEAGEKLNRLYIQILDKHYKMSLQLKVLSFNSMLWGFRGTWRKGALENYSRDSKNKSRFSFINAASIKWNMLTRTQLFVFPFMMLAEF